MTKASASQQPTYQFLNPKRESLPEAIANVVAEAIASGQLAPGARIVETALTTSLNVSRVPVREALKVLHTQGIIEGGSHRGFRVATFSPKMVQSVQEARIDLETLLLRDAVANWQSGAADVKELDAVIARMRTAARAGDFEEMLRADLAFHRVICDAAQNPIFATLWTAIARHVLIILNLARFRDTDLSVVVRRHIALKDQIIMQIAQRGSVADLRTILEAHFLAERASVIGEPAAGKVKPRASRRPPSGKTRS
ncbi:MULTISPECIES: GntR family transcriptional regulator [Hyphomicrobiales]|uniref:GntR family transcriptional regulator n=1 Tax=Hyphomicrobiales TaxID=356 RepID=UPI001BD13199|nr:MULTISPECIES: GntR family transcriptional regulator [Hyphomicrobiales]MBS7742749.1 GntR family transcriptional regulator [Chelatococcus sp. HY11]MBX3491246.1 GntR family transcriptional regulator [Parvibaculum sp.]MBX3491256.1 GntR family transcriptional regulator [Parvibaculum sp.]MBX3542133.1 GntR family transcriptional regulator [Chelatococcus sp.]MCO5075652.1 GntR family transcriptional regulator [Chelatococcus sp.]